MEPLYTAKNTNPAYQLNWSVSLFGRNSLPSLGEWLDALKESTEPDGVRILEFNLTRPDTAQLLISTVPHVAPAEVLRSVKGRWQNQFRKTFPQMFRRNYFISSVGETHCGELDQYISLQTERHTMADARVQKTIEELQFHDDTVDLGLVRGSSHGQFIYGLQVVVQNESGWSETDSDLLKDLQETTRSVAKQHDWLLSRIGLLTNHLHVLLGPAITDSPESVALSLMNELANVYDLKPVLRYSYYAGTFGRYDRNAIRHRL
jgi:REP element-mobilizing transposase RayT